MSQPTLVRFILLTLLGFMLAEFVTFGFQLSPAQATTEPFVLPFDAGTTFYVCQGYKTPAATTTLPYTHSGIFALDLSVTAPNPTGHLCTVDNASAGKKVRAPFTGKVVSWDPSYGRLCIKTTDGSTSVALIHLDSPSVTTANAPISRGNVLGTVAPRNTVHNNGVAHLHIQAWANSLCSGTTIPFDTAHHTALSGYDLYNKGATSYNQWRTQQLKRPAVTLYANVGGGHPMWTPALTSSSTSAVANFPDLSTINSDGIHWNDKISGVQVNIGCSVTLYRNTNYAPPTDGGLLGAQTLTLTSTDLDIRDRHFSYIDSTGSVVTRNWSDQASSLRISCR